MRSLKMQDKILDFLRKKQEYTSGEEISGHLNVSRQALWKHINQLKEAGYDIVAVPHLGYKLLSCPDRLFPSEITRKLHTKIIGKKIYYFDEVASTMDVATQLGIKSSAEGTLVAAEAQSRGRGRLGRTWASPKYKGIYISLILRPKIPPTQVSILTLLAAVSICQAIKETVALDAKIKWPNDILSGRKKLGGILTELAAEMDEVRFLVIGIGLNVNNDAKTLVEGATSLKEETAQTINRIELLQEILRKIEKNYLAFCKEGSANILDDWRDYNLTLGKRVKIVSQNTHLEGQAVDIDSDGGLLIRKDSGITAKVTAGDVVHCR